MKKERIATILSLAVMLVCTSLSNAFAEPMINDIRFESPTAAVDQIIFELNGPHLPIGKALPGDNPRVYFDFLNTVPAKKVKTLMPTNGNFVKQIRYAYHKGEDSKTRVVFDLVANEKMDFKQDFDLDTNTLVITLFLAGTEPDIAVVKPALEPEPGAFQPPAEEEPAAVEEEPATPELPAEDAGKEVPPIEEVSVAVAPEPETQMPPQVEETLPAELEPAKEEAPVEVAMPEPEAEPEAAPEPVAELKPEAEPEPAPEPVAISEPETEPEPVTQEEMPLVASIPPSTTLPENLETPVEESTVIQPMSEIGFSDKKDIEDTAPVLQSIEFDPNSNRGEMINFKLNGFHPPVVFGIEEDIPRIVCFFKNASAGSELKDMIRTNGKYVKNIKIGKYKNPDNIRVVLELIPGNNYDLQQIFFKDDKIFMMIINKAGKQISSQSN